MYAKNKFLRMFENLDRDVKDEVGGLMLSQISATPSILLSHSHSSLFFLYFLFKRNTDGQKVKDFLSLISSER